MPDKHDDNGFAAGTFVADRVGRLLETVPGYLKAERFDRIADAATTAGHWGLLAVAVLGFVIELIGTGSHGGSALLWGVGWLVVLPLLQYVAVQFLGITRSMVTANATTLGSQAFLRCYALVALVAAIAALVGAVARGLDTGSVQVFLFGVAVTALWLATAWLALNPSLLGIRINRQSGAGEEAIGVLSFFVKSAVRIVPIFYGVTMVVAAIQAVVLLLRMIGASSTELMMIITRAEFSAPVVVTAALSPFLAYIGFVLYFLVIDLMRGILSIPGRPGTGGAPSGARSARKKSASKKKTAGSGPSASGSG